MITKIISHIPFVPSTVTFTASCGESVFINTTHAGAIIGEGTLQVTINTVNSTEEILFAINYNEDCEPTVHITTFVEENCVEDKTIEIVCIPEIPTVTYDCNTGLSISPLVIDSQYMPGNGVFLADGNHVLHITTAAGCLSSIPFVVEGCCIDINVLASYNCVSKKIKLSFFDPITDSPYTANLGWEVNISLTSAYTCIPINNPLDMIQGNSHELISVDSLDLCNGNYSVEVNININYSCFINTTLAINCACADIFQADYNCTTKEITITSDCNDCLYYIKKNNASGFLYGPIPDDDSFIPSFETGSPTVPQSDTWYEITNLTSSVSSFIDSGDLTSDGGLANGVYIIYTTNNNCVELFTLVVTCQNVACNFIHYDDGIENEPDVRIFTVGNLSQAVYLDLFTGGHPDYIEVYYSNNTNISVSGDTLLVKTPPLCDYQCDPQYGVVIPGHYVKHGFWSNNIGTGTAAQPYIYNGANSLLYTQDDGLPLDFNITELDMLPTYPYGGGNLEDAHYTINPLLYAASSAFINPLLGDGIFVSGVNVTYLSNNHLMVGSSARLNFVIDGTKEYVKVRFNYNNNYCREFFPGTTIPWISGLHYFFPFCSDCAYSGLTCGIEVDEYDDVSGQIILNGTYSNFNSTIVSEKWFILNSNQNLCDVGHAIFLSTTIDDFNTTGSTVTIQQEGGSNACVGCANINFFWESDFRVAYIVADDKGNTAISYFKHEADCSGGWKQYISISPEITSDGTDFSIHVENEYYTTFGDIFEDGTSDPCLISNSVFEYNAPAVITPNVNHIYSDVLANGSGVIGALTLDCTKTTTGYSTFQVSCQPSSCSTTIPVVGVIPWNCPDMAEFELVTPCGAGSTIEYSLNGGVSWGSTLPVYNGIGTASLLARCVNITEKCYGEFSDIVQINYEDCVCIPCNPSFSSTPSSGCVTDDGEITIDDADTCTNFTIGGIAPIANVWAGLAEGDYVIEYYEDISCPSTQIVQVENDITTITFTANNLILSCGSSKASIFVNSIAGGTAPYTYNVLLNNVSVASGAIVVGETSFSSIALPAGNYSVEVIDDRGCKKTQTVTINLCNNPLTFTLTPVNTSCGASNGELHLTAITAGGTNLIKYKLNTTTDVGSDCSCTFATGWIVGSTDITRLAPGVYTVCLEKTSGLYNNCCACRTATIAAGLGACNISCGITTGVASATAILNNNCNRSVCTNNTVHFYANFVGAACSPQVWTFDGNVVVPTVIAGGYRYSVNTTGLSAGTYDLEIEYGLCGSIYTMSIDIVAVPVINAIPNSTICVGSSVSLNFTGTATSFTYVSSNPIVSIISDGLVAGTGDFQITGLSVGTTNITITPSSNGCNGAQVSFLVTVAPTTSQDHISNQTVCAGNSTNVVSINPSYTWTNSNTNIGLAASGTGNIPSFVATNATTNTIIGTITITPVSAFCPGVPSTYTISVYPRPTIGAIADISVCDGASINIPDFTSNLPGATYIWTNDKPQIGLAASGTGNPPTFIANNSSGAPIVANLAAFATVNGCPGNVENFTITIQPELELGARIPAYMCQTQNINAAIANPGVTLTNCSGSNTYGIIAGNLPTGITLNTNTGALTGIASTLGTFTFTIQGTCNGTCSLSSEHTIIVVCCESPTINTNFSSSYQGNVIDNVQIYGSIHCCTTLNYYLVKSVVNIGMSAPTTGFVVESLVANPLVSTSINFNVPANTYLQKDVYYKIVCASTLNNALACANNPTCNACSNVLKKTFL